MKKNFSISQIDQNFTELDYGLSNGGIFNDVFDSGGISTGTFDNEFINPIDKIPSSTGFPTYFDDSVVQQSSCTVYQNQSDADWMGDYQMCDGTWQYGGYIGAGASVCLVSGSPFTLSGMDLVPLYRCGDEPPVYGKPQPNPPSYGEPQNPIEIPEGFNDDQQPIGTEMPVPTIEKMPMPQGVFIDDLVYMPDKIPTGFPTFFDDSVFPSYGEPQNPIEIPKIQDEQQIKGIPMPTYGEPQNTIEQPQIEKMPMEEHPIDQFISGNTTTPPMASSPMASSTEPTAAAASVAKPIAKPIGKNLTPYIYAGVGIIVILVVARMVTKK